MFKKKSPITTINWHMYTSLSRLWEETVMDNIDEGYGRFVRHLCENANGAESLKTTKRRLSPETRADPPAWSSTSVRQLPTDVRACEATQRGDKGRP
ncbi:unnamed protein product [Heligmosomoides polygyrus]|uniref:Transposase n=1 Tax=Heligmosomoides polygyrus TaxID=6339 RepID=A0A183FR42_HELPZ|nr:unnamed protein product [Heligmosomoides polygyrus]